MRIVLALMLLALGQEPQEPPDRSNLDTADLATELETADREIIALRGELDTATTTVGTMSIELAALSHENERLKFHLDRAMRPHILLTLGRILLTRYMAPVDLWLENPPLAKEPLPFVGQPPKWYVLVIHPQNPHRGTKLWIKFYLDPAEARTADTDYWSFHFMRQYAQRRRDGLLTTLEHHLVQSMQDPDAVETMIDGTAHLYRLVTQDSDVDRLRKEDRIY